MITTVPAEKHLQSGLRPFDPYRDSKQVVELMALAFGDDLSLAGQVVLAEMRRVVRWGSLLGWLSWSGAGGVVPWRGFVWVEDGRVVGNASLRRAPERGGFLVGNVAVHPDWRGRGIAGRLMDVVLDDVAARDGRWVGLEVKVDNQVARRLYERLGFEEVGRTVYMLRPPGMSQVHEPACPLLRRGRSRDGAALVELVKSVIPDRLRPLLELRKRDYQPGWERTLDLWMEGRRESWWVIDEQGVVGGAVRALRERGRRPDWLEVLAAPEHGRFEEILVQQGLACLRGGSRKAIETMLALPADSLIQTLQDAGFRRERVLVQMKLACPRQHDGRE